MQDFANDPMGTLMQGLFECIDQYESELNGPRTSAAMREAVRQGFWPGARAPYGYRTVPVEVRPGVVHHRLEVEPREAEVVREAFNLYVAGSGSLSVARALNQRGRRTRQGELWSKNRVVLLLREEALTGTVVWGRRKKQTLQPKSEWLTLEIPRIIDDRTWSLVQWCREEREPRRSAGLAPSVPKLLKGVLWCGACGASYQYETSGKRYSDELYTYEYYNCRSRVRIGKEACAGFRIAMTTLDNAIISELARVVCTEARARVLAEARGWPVAQVLEAWREILRRPEIARTYVMHLIERIEVHGLELKITPKPGGRNDPPPSPVAT